MCEAVVGSAGQGPHRGYEQSPSPKLNWSLRDASAQAKKRQPESDAQHSQQVVGRHGGGLGDLHGSLPGIGRRWKRELEALCPLSFTRSFRTDTPMHCIQSWKPWKLTPPSGPIEPLYADTAPTGYNLGHDARRAP